MKSALKNTKTNNKSDNKFELDAKRTRDYLRERIKEIEKKFKELTGNFFEVKPVSKNK